MAYCPNCNNPVAADALSCAVCDAQFGAGSAWKPTKKPSGPPRPRNKSTAASAVPAAADASGQKKNWWSLRWIWPRVYDLESARFATQYGFWGAVWICVVTAVLATISVVAQEPILGMDAWAYIDAMLMGIVAWRIKHFSRAFAICGVALGVFNVIVTVATPPPIPGSNAFAGAMYGLIVFFINGARGVFAYNRFKPTSVWGESSRAWKLNQQSGTGPTAATTIRDSATEDRFFEQALTEVESGQTIKALWARALAGAEGDDAKAKALYIRYRVKALIASAEQATPEQVQATHESEKTAVQRGRDEAEPQELSIPQPPSEPVNTFTGREKVQVLVFVAVVIALFLTGIYLKQEGNETIVVVPAPRPAGDSQGTRQPAKSLYDGIELAPIQAAPPAPKSFLDAYELAPSVSQPPAREAAGARESIPASQAGPSPLEIIAAREADAAVREVMKPWTIPAPTSDDLKAAAQGAPGKQHMVGIGYARSVPPDYEQAAFWFERAAKQGYAPAQSSLGSMYADGKGVARDYTLAVFWFQKGAALGDGGAQHSLGTMYEQGRGVPQDHEQAKFWFEKAAAKRDAIAMLAQFSLYSLYSNGEAKDKVESLKWATIAAANGMLGLEKRREALEIEMTREQIAEAQRRASEWVKAHK